MTRAYNLYSARDDHISMQEASEMTFDVFQILLNFCLFLCFLEIAKELNAPYWVRYSYFKVGDVVFTKDFGR